MNKQRCNIALKIISGLILLTAALNGIFQGWDVSLGIEDNDRMYFEVQYNF